MKYLFNSVFSKTIVWDKLSLFLNEETDEHYWDAQFRVFHSRMTEGRNEL